MIVTIATHHKPNLIITTLHWFLKLYFLKNKQTNSSIRADLSEQFIRRLSAVCLQCRHVEVVDEHEHLLSAGRAYREYEWSMRGVWGEYEGVWGSIEEYGAGPFLLREREYSGVRGSTEEYVGGHF